MSKFKERLNTVVFAFGFPVLMATVMTLTNSDGLLINGDSSLVKTFSFFFVLSFGLESSLFVLVAVCYLIYKGE